MTILSSHSSSNLTTGTIHNHTVDDIDEISKGNDRGSVTELDTEEPHSNKWSDLSYTYWPENQLGLPENKCWGIQGNIFIRIHIEGGHHVGPVFNFNFQSNKWGIELEDAGVREGPMPDCMQEK